jgi:hypothetical protein
VSANAREREIVRDLARQVAEIAARPVQQERREFWRAHNSFRNRGCAVILRWGACAGEVIGPQLVCEDPFLRGWEGQLRRSLFQDATGDDFIIEPWVTIRAAYTWPGPGPWGVQYGRQRSEAKGGAWKNQPPIREEGDIEKLQTPYHEIDEEATRRQRQQVEDLLGDLLTVNVDRAPLWRVWTGDLATDLGHLRGIDQFMYDMMDRPEWLKKLLGFMRDGVLKAHREAEEAGDWCRAATQNQSMPYADETVDPEPNVCGVRREELWGFFAAQEFALTGPEQHDEFMFQFQLPIMEAFGLVSYGCCEDLTRKIDMLRQLKNLRSIAVTPVADPVKCAEQIGGDYLISWRPNPAETVCCGWQPEKTRALLRHALEAFQANGCFAEINLKDVQTVENEPQRLADFVALCREEIERVGAVRA